MELAEGDLKLQIVVLPTKALGPQPSLRCLPGEDGRGSALLGLPGQLSDEGAGLAHVLALPIGQGLLAGAFGSLIFIKEDRGRTHQGQIARRIGMAHLAVIFPLGMIAPVMLFDFNPPVLSDSFEQELGRGFLGPEAGHPVKRLVGDFDDPAPAEDFDVAIDADNLRGSGQAQGGSIDGDRPEGALFQAPVSLTDRLSLRGKSCPAAVAGLWPTRAVGCL